MSTPTLLTHLVVKDAVAAIAFYQAAFGAVERFRLTDPSGKVGHAELSLGGTTLMLAEEYPEYGVLSPSSMDGQSGALLNLVVADVAAALEGARAAGAEVLAEPKLEFYGDEVAKLRDPSGHRWTLSRTVEKLSPQEMQSRFSALFAD